MFNYIQIFKFSNKSKYSNIISAKYEPDPVCSEYSITTIAYYISQSPLIHNWTSELKNIRHRMFGWENSIEEFKRRSNGMWIEDGIVGKCQKKTMKSALTPIAWTCQFFSLLFYIVWWMPTWPGERCLATWRTASGTSCLSLSLRRAPLSSSEHWKEFKSLKV